MGGVINVSYPKFRALSIDSSFEHIKTIHLMIQWYLYRSSVFTQKWLPWQPGVKSEMALLLKMFYWGQSICLPTFMLVPQSERFQLILTLATGLRGLFLDIINACYFYYRSTCSLQVMTC